jgi:futalosine hydrolase
LLLVPTALERDGLAALGGFPGHQPELAGFGPVAAAARAATLLAGRPRPTLLVGLGGSLRARELPVGAATTFAAVSLEGLGARTGKRILAPSELGFAQWRDARGAVGERLPLARGARGELLTVAVASGTRAEARQRARAFPRARVEDMEGFGVALACRLVGAPLVIVRGISNIAGERDRSRWNIEAALLAAHALAHTWLEGEDWRRPR